ncbi:MAG: hypothetical protein ACI4QT_11105 [Kiritimatiellia bacterium]
MPASEPCETNNVGELAYEYQPETMFRGYSDYVLFATPITRQVSQVRAVCVIDEDEADGEIAATVKRLEAKFGKKSLKLGDGCVIFFENGDMITVTKQDAFFKKKIFIDAVCNRLNDLTKKEVAQVEGVSLSKDSKTLNLLPKKEDGEDKVFQIDSVFGVSFGEKFTKGYNPEQNNVGAWAYNYHPNGPFVDCEDFCVFATAKTRKVFMVRAVYDGDNDAEASRHYELMQRLVERETGRKFKDGEEKGKNKSCSMKFGDVLITLEKDWLRDNVTLDFVRISLYKQSERENDEEERSEMSGDLDAL